MIPQVVVFDLGKVLVDFDYGIAARKIAQCSNVSAGEVLEFICQSPLLGVYETGQINRQEFFERVRARSGFRGDLQQFGSYFADIFQPIVAMVDLAGQLRLRQMPRFIFSNTNDLAIEHIRRNFPFFSEFDGYVLSYEHGVMKPDHKLYEAVERVSGATGQQILFLDDRSENAAAGQARGWQVIHHQKADQTIALVKQMGLLAK
jgi:FMN phosphatase YigB (HAD superfamily)